MYKCFKFSSFENTGEGIEVSFILLKDSHPVHLASRTLKVTRPSLLVDFLNFGFKRLLSNSIIELVLYQLAAVFHAHLGNKNINAQLVRVLDLTLHSKEI